MTHWNNNKNLNDLQYINDFNKIKEIINIRFEKEKLDLLIKDNNNNKRNNRI